MSFHHHLAGGFSKDFKPLSKHADNDIIYTEDNIPVRTIYVSGVPIHTKENTIKLSFKAYGEVESVRMHTNNKSNKAHQFIYAFVTFSSAKIAARVLRARNINISGKRVKLFRADSWHQPKQIAERNISENEKEIDFNQSLLLLNDDCILYIFKYLDAVDLTYFARTCLRLRKLTAIYFKRFNQFNFRNNIDKNDVSLMVTRDVLQEIGPFIVDLNMCGLHFCSQKNRYLTLIMRYCKQLEKLQITLLPITLHGFQNNKNAFQNLKTLEISHCSGTYDHILTRFTSPLQLQTLKLTHCLEFEGQCLKQFKNLETLQLSDCNNVNGNYLKSFFENCPFLKNLTISGCNSSRSQKLFDYVATYLKSLEMLNIQVYTSPDMHMVVNDSSFNNLKVLNLSKITKNIDQLLYRFAEKNLLLTLDLSDSNVTDDTINELIKLTNLQILKLNNQYDLTDNMLIKLGEALTELKKFELRKCYSITEEAIPKFVKLCKTLEVLDLTSCSFLTALCITKTIDILKKQKRPKLEIKLGDTDFEELTDKNDIIEANSEYVQITFDSIAAVGDLFEDHSDVEMLEDDDFFMENEDYSFNYLDDDDDDDDDGYDYDDDDEDEDDVYAFNLRLTDYLSDDFPLDESILYL